jgi:murein DD-endopeptidase MepM/ murein hydrolase activator NlpD
MTHFLQRTALIALASGALGACTTDEALRPNFPTRAPETAPPPASPPAAAPTPPPPPADEPTTAAPAAPVEQRPLEPLPPASSPAPQGEAAPPPAPIPAPPPAPVPAAAPPAPAPAYREVTTRAVTGRVVEVEGRASTYKVRKGDTLEEIADKLGTSVSQLREDNHLRKRATIHPGQVIHGPPRRGRAYVAGQGDTLYSISRRFSVTADALREENGLSRSATLHAGEKIRLPEGYHDRGPLVSTNRVLASGGSESIFAAQADPQERDEPAAPPPPAAAPRPAASAPMAPSYRTVTTRSVTGKVVEVEGRAVSYTVRKGDNLEKIAGKLDTTVDQLRDDNDLGRHEKIHPGQELKGPRSTAHAYVAGAGDTLYSISRRFGVSAEALRDENDLSRNASLRPGQKIRLPTGYRDHGPLTSTTRIPEAPAYAPPSPPPPYAPPAASPPPRPYIPPAVTPPPASAPAATPPYTPPAYTPPASTPLPRPYNPPPPPPRTYVPPPAAPAPPVAGPMAAPSPGDAQISELGRGRFIWPLQGPIVSDFGPKAPGQRNDGVNIGAEVGAGVHAAAGGTVVYAGDQVPGFGNLVLIKHADGWVTAYGHLSRVLVRMQQTVVQGQEIGLAGATGGVSEPQLHFEIRYASSPLERAKPVDPRLVLPK